MALYSPSWLVVGHHFPSQILFSFSYSSADQIFSSTSLSILLLFNWLEIFLPQNLASLSFSYIFFSSADQIFSSFSFSIILLFYCQHLHIKDRNMNKKFALFTWSSSETIFENRFVCSPLNCRGLDVFAKRTSIMNYNISQGASMGKYLEEMIIKVHFPSQPVQYCALFLWVFVLWGLLYRAPLYTTAGPFTIIMIIIHLIDII